MIEKVESHWQIPSEMHNLRADQYLARRIGRISRTRASSIIEAKDFLLDGRAVKSSSRVKSGQRATIRRLPPDHVDDVNDFDVKIIYEDNDILVVDKPPHLSIHPTANCLYKTLTHWLRKNFVGKIHPCHRIDKETSGVVVCAKNPKFESAIKKNFMYGHVQKTYLAVVDGKISLPQLIDLPLGLQQHRGLVRIRMIHDGHGKPASTKIRPLFVDEKRDRSLVLCRPYTGRQHQIRAHLSLIGHPIVGDKLYGKGDDFFNRLSLGEDVLHELPHPRHALHAARLSMRVFDRKFIWKSPLAKDLLTLIAT